jgi:glycosyltransferase involved in cell wall biosynthesis
MRICLVTPRLPPERCGVGDYTARLAVQLASSHDVTIVSGCQSVVEIDPSVDVAAGVPDWGYRGMKMLENTLRELRPDWVCIQYVPFLYHRVGMTFWLPATVLRMRAKGMRVLLMVHEPYVPLDSPTHVVMGSVQRLMLWTLMAGSEKVAVATTKWTRILKRLAFPRAASVFHLPVGSNLPRLDMTGAERDRHRAQLGFGPDDVVVAMIRPNSAGKQPGVALEVWQQLNAVNPKAKLLVLGDDGGCWAAAGAHTAGHVPAARASQLLSIADLFFAPFVDGMSTRRTSVMAAMAHGLPVVTTKGHLTDPLFEGSPLLMCAPDDAGAMRVGLENLVKSADARDRAGVQTIAFFERHFSWPVLAAQLNRQLAHSYGA